MGWSWLGKVGKIAAGVAAPFTGGASLSAIPAIDGISKGLASGSQAAASNRGTKAEIMMDQNAQLEQQLLAREQEKRQAQAQAYRAAMMGNYAQNYKPLSRPSGVPGTYEATAGTGELGKILQKQAMTRLGASDLNNMTGMQPYRNLANYEQFKKTLDPGFWEKLSGIGSVAAPILGGIFGGGSDPNK
jgi:hypothetical protein